jgi:flagellar hook protein FlgE
MGLTSALYTGLSGLNANQFRIDTIGDNISNANTTGYKSSRSMFQTQFAQMLSLGTPPSGNQGGTNGLEVGLGTLVGAVQRNMTQGSTETTGVPSDLAIDGQGFFVVRTADNRQSYTRDGSFILNANNYLVTADGNYVQGFGVDTDFNIVPGTLTDLQIPLGSLAMAKATSAAYLQGNLSPDGPVGSQGTRYLSNALVQDAVGTVATGATLLTDLRDSASPGVNLFAAGDVLTLSGVTKGGRTLPDATFVVGTTGTTVSDLTNWLQSAMGINTAAGVPGSPGVSIDGTGAIVINGNTGEFNALRIEPGDITSSNATTPNPFTFTMPTDASGTPIDAVGNSAYTTFRAYDSLGMEVRVDLTMVLESKGGPGGNVWRYYAESPDDTVGGRIVGTGTLTFGPDGKVLPGTTGSVQIDRAGTGASSPLVINLDMSSLQGFAGSGSSGSASGLIVTRQDGFPPGELNNYAVGADGIITGTFTNGLSRTLGQVVLGTFPNPAGLVRQTDNLFTEGPNSGQVAITTPLNMGAGRVLSGALELSNVDLAREFIGLINASSGFTASSRVITTSNQLLNDLMMLMRG